MSLSHHILFISWANLRHFPNLFPPSLSDGAKISNSSTMRWRVQYLRHLKGLSKRKTYFMDIENRLHRLFHCRLLHLWDGNNITFLLMFDFVYQRNKSCRSSVCILRRCQNSMRKAKKKRLLVPDKIWIFILSALCIVMKCQTSLYLILYL